MHIRLYDYAHVPSKVLVKAEGQTGMIFRQAGVEVTWENSVPPKDPSQAKPTSPRPPDAASVDLRIVTHFESISGALRHHSMGFAVPPDTASISLEWVEKLASLGVAEEYQVLGAAMTHERSATCSWVRIRIPQSASCALAGKRRPEAGFPSQAHLYHERGQAHPNRGSAKPGAATNSIRIRASDHSIDAVVRKHGAKLGNQSASSQLRPGSS
jgi:hypothetical protein